MKSIYTGEKLESFVLIEEMEIKVEWLDAVYHRERTISRFGTLTTVEGKEVEAIITRAADPYYNFVIWEEEGELDIAKAKDLIIEKIKFLKLKTEKF